SGQRREVWDALVPGLGVRVTDAGTKSFVLATRYPGSANPARRALGGYGELTLEQARIKARHWLELVGQGIDPHVEGERQRLARLRPSPKRSSPRSYPRSAGAGMPSYTCGMSSFRAGAGVPSATLPPPMSKR